MNIMWVKAAAVRAVKTFAQTFAASLSASSMISEVDWKIALSTAALSFLYSIVTSLAGLPEVDLVKEKPQEEKAE